MKNFILPAIAVTMLVSCNSQKAARNANEIASKPESEIAPGQVIEYNPHPENSRLAILHDKLIKSESYQTAEKLTDSLISCMPKDFNNWDLLHEDDTFTAWLESNMHLTKFKSIENAVKLNKDMGDAVMRDHEENAEFYDVWLNTDPDNWEFSFYAP